MLITDRRMVSCLFFSVSASSAFEIRSESQKRASRYAIRTALLGPTGRFVGIIARRIVAAASRVKSVCNHRQEIIPL